MWDRILTVTILIFSGLLLLSSGVIHFMDPVNVMSIQPIQSYIGITLIGLSITLAILNLLFTSHIFYEYWFIVLLGSMVGVIYVA